MWQHQKFEMEKFPQSVGYGRGERKILPYSIASAFLRMQWAQKGKDDWMRENVMQMFCPVAFPFEWTL